MMTDHSYREHEQTSQDIKSVAIMLGPYRNLTTLTASVCALHPQVQVLNHAADRLWAQADLDFFATPELSVLDRFVATAIRDSEGGRRGDHGGSILLSHAFDNDAMREAYQRRFGNDPRKTGPRCLLWKESMRVQRRLMDTPGRVDEILDRLPMVRFVLPIRNPLDCAMSNMRTGHARYLTQDPDPERVVDAVLAALAWALALRDRRPDRVFAFHQHEISAQMMGMLGDFLQIDLDPQWIADAGDTFRVRDSRIHPDAIVDYYRRAAMDVLAPWPSLLETFSLGAIPGETSDVPA